ncbi:MAG: 3-phosphoshikimate 1-carboxyvinyltransferase [Clostridia bacterium]|nr:3-phosphoshikimate 1-carboxyvinyltransferase [Clostridia bacterium]
MRKTLRAFRPAGTVRMQPSKSVLHRALICAALAPGESELLNFAWSDDIQATARCLEDLGMCHISVSGSVCTVQGGLNEPGRPELDCGESGSTVRFLLPLALDGSERTFVGRGRLMQRPFAPYADICREQDIRFEHEGDRITVCGSLLPGTFSLPGDISSQFITGLLLALPRLEEPSAIELETPLESAGYVEITRSVQELFGVSTEAHGDSFRIGAPQSYRPAQLAVEGDYSHATFFAVAAALAGKLEIAGLNPDSVQGDRAVFELLSRIGADLDWNGQTVTVTKGDLQPFDMDVSQIPDAVPALSVLAAGINGTSHIRNAGRVRLKESDRLQAMAEELARLGVNVEQGEDSLTVHGTGRLRGGDVETHGDHRVAMALAVASLLADEPVVIHNAEVVAKSGPQFFREWEIIGGTEA